MRVPSVDPLCGSYWHPDLDAIALEALPPSPARNAETRYTIRLNLNAPNTHRCPPTMPGPPTMSTCTRYNRQSQPAARNAPDAAATIESCADLPSAAPPTGSGMIPTMPPMPAPLTHGPVSCHEKSAASPIARPVTRLRYTSRPSFAQSRAKTVPKMSQNCPRPNPVTSCQPNILSRGETKFLPKLHQTVRYRAFDTLSIPCPYPISAATQLVLDTFGHIWATCYQNGPRPGPSARFHRQGAGIHHRLRPRFP